MYTPPLKPAPRTQADAAARTTGWALVLLGLGVAACSPAVNRTPLSDAAKTAQQQYLYGPTGDGVVVASADEAVTEEDDGPEQPAAENDATEKDEDEDSEDSEVVATGSDSEDAESPAAKQPALVAGTYKGTDWVTITLPGFPDDEQVDDQARVVLAVLDKPERYSFAVLDTRSGDELCKIVGTLSDSIITFDEEQTCFSGILGVPMEANITTGIATIDGKSLTVTLGVELTVNTPNGDLTGDLDYRFEGKK